MSVSASEVTAVIVNYNYARFLPDAVGSVLDQSQPFASVVVVNDGSTDESLSVLAAYGDALRVVDIPNSGQLGATEAGLSQVRSTYVYFLDADDFCMPDMNEVVSPLCDATTVKIQFQLQGVDENGDPLESVFPTFPDPYTAAMMREDNRRRGFYVCPPTSGNVYLAAALRSLNWDRLDKRDFSDGVPAMLMPELGPVVSVRRPLACYRVHGGSDSQYSRPRPETMRRDRARYLSRWRQAQEQIPAVAAPVEGTTEYEAELDFLEAALSERRPGWGVTSRYLSRIAHSRESAKRKALLLAWVVATAGAPSPKRHDLVASRRSSANRSGAMNSFLRKVLGRRAA